MKCRVTTLLSVLFLTACGTDLDRYGVSLDRSQSLSGYDKNNDGIRDDIHRYISLNIVEEKQASAAKQLARSYQLSLTVNKKYLHTVQGVARNESRAMSCIFQAFPGGKFEGHYIAPFLLNMTVNTGMRRTEYAAYLKSLNGYVAPVFNEVCS